MIIAAHRIRSGDDFRKVFKAGVRVRSDHLMAHSLLDTDDSHAARVGFIVSKAVGNAVIRNRVKRRLREIMHHRIQGLEPGRMLVIRAQPNAAAADYRCLETEVVELLERAEKKQKKRSDGRQRSDHGR